MNVCSSMQGRSTNATSCHALCSASSHIASVPCATSGLIGFDLTNNNKHLPRRIRTAGMLDLCLIPLSIPCLCFKQLFHLITLPIIKTACIAQLMETMPIYTTSSDLVQAVEHEICSHTQYGVKSGSRR